jgi:hypothetical protein
MIVHYQLGQGWPLCGERPVSYDSTAVWPFVTCLKCLSRRSCETTQVYDARAGCYVSVAKADLCGTNDRR